MNGRRRLRLNQKRGFSLIELMIVMSLVAALIILAVPSLFEAFTPRLKTSAQNLNEDLKFAQNEAVRQGGAVPGGGSFRNRRVFFVFDIDDDSYSIWRWEDANGNNLRDEGEFNPDLAGKSGEDMPVRTGRLDSGVSFHIPGIVTKSACGGSGPAPGNPVTFRSEGLPPCNGNPCIRFDGKGFIEGLNGAAYLADRDHAYAVSANRAGLFSLCRWDEEGNNWVAAH